MMPLYLITTPVAVLPSLGLDVSVGVSGDDPMADRAHTDSYELTCSLYKSDGSFVGRPCLGTGRIEAGERQLHSLSDLSRKLKIEGDHLAVVHRIPRDYTTPRDYNLFRACVQYQRSGSANYGRVIYESPPSLNVAKLGKRPSSTLTHTNTIMGGKDYTNYLVLLHYSMDAAYKETANYHYAVFDQHGERIDKRTVEIGPFQVRAVALPEWTNLCTLVGWCDSAALVVLVLTLHHPTNSITVEHTSPAQSQTMCNQDWQRNEMKKSALESWEKALC